MCWKFSFQIAQSQAAKGAMTAAAAAMQLATNGNHNAHVSNSQVRLIDSSYLSKLKTVDLISCLHYHFFLQKKSDRLQKC